MVRTKMMSLFWCNCTEEHNAKDPNAGSTDNQQAISAIHLVQYKLASLLFIRTK